MKVKDKFKITVEKTKDGYSAFYKPNKRTLITTTAKDLSELFDMLKDATELTIKSVK